MSSKKHEGDSTMNDFEIYFNDLNEEAQLRLMKAVGITDPKEMNWDLDWVPLAFYPLPEYAD